MGCKLLGEPAGPDPLSEAVSVPSYRPYPDQQSQEELDQIYQTDKPSSSPGTGRVKGEKETRSYSDREPFPGKETLGMGTKHCSLISITPTSPCTNPRITFNFLLRETHKPLLLKFLLLGCSVHCTCYKNTLTVLLKSSELVYAPQRRSKGW